MKKIKDTIVFGEKVKIVPPNISWKHENCYYHIIHPCELCGRINRKGYSYIKLVDWINFDVDKCMFFLVCM